MSAKKDMINKKIDKLFGLLVKRIESTHRRASMMALQVVENMADDEEDTCSALKSQYESGKEEAYRKALDAINNIINGYAIEDLDI